MEFTYKSAYPLCTIGRWKLADKHSRISTPPPIVPLLSSVVVVATDKPCPIGTKFWENMGMICAMTTSHLSASANRSISGKTRNTPADASLFENWIKPKNRSIHHWNWFVETNPMVVGLASNGWQLMAKIRFCCGLYLKWGWELN